MAYRYCRDGERWLETANYGVDDTGETTCRKDGHGHVIGYIDGSIRTARELENSLRRTYSDDSLIREMVGAAKRQNLVEPGRGSNKTSASLGNRFGL